jgi:hypothetical protein
MKNTSYEPPHCTVFSSQIPRTGIKNFCNIPVAMVSIRNWSRSSQIYVHVTYKFHSYFTIWKQTRFAFVSLYLETGTAQWYSARLWARWSAFRVPAGAGNFSLHHRIQTGSGTHPASYPMGTRGSLPDGKAVGVWNWPLTPSSAEVKNTWSYTSTPQHGSRRGTRLKHREKFNFF